MKTVTGGNADGDRYEIGGSFERTPVESASDGQRLASDIGLACSVMLVMFGAPVLLLAVVVVGLVMGR